MFNLIAEQDRAISRMQQVRGEYRFRTIRAFRRLLARNGYTREQVESITQDMEDMYFLIKNAQ